MDMFNKIFHIELHKAENYEKGKGLARIFDNGIGVIINYSAHCSHLEKHIIICHELGHILLHMRKNEKDNNWYFPPITLEMEAEADYFAKEILKERAAQFRNTDNDFFQKILFSDGEIDEALEKML